MQMDVPQFVLRIYGGLEQASVHQNIIPFTDFLAPLIRNGLAGGPLPKVPVR